MRTAHCTICGKARPVIADPFQAQAATPGKLRRLLRGLSRAQLLRRPAPGKWSIHELVCHLADTEVANAWRYRKVLAEGAIGETAWNQDRWAAKHDYRRQSLRLALEQFTVLRARDLALLAVVGRKAWARKSTHPTLPGLSAADMLTHLAHHDANHLGQIARIREALKSRKPGRPPVATSRG